jgi:hypothetical protein
VSAMCWIKFEGDEGLEIFKCSHVASTMRGRFDLEIIRNA